MLLIVLLLVFLVICGGGGLVAITSLVVGIVLLRRQGDDVTVRRAVTVGAESVSNVFRRTPAGLAEVDPDDPEEAMAFAREALAAHGADRLIEHTSSYTSRPRPSAPVERSETVDTTFPFPASGEIPPPADDPEPPDEPELPDEGATEAVSRVVAPVRFEDDDVTGLTEAKTRFAPRARKLRRVGFFAELPHGDPAGGSLSEARRDAAQPHEARIVAYLRAAPVLVEEADSVADVLDPAGEWLGPASVHTDGVWAWPADLAHYVEHYHVILPTPFVEHLVDRGYQVGEVDLDAVDL